MPKTKIDQEICKGCKLCISACPRKIIELDKEQFNKKGFHPAKVFDMEKCSGCAACAMFCPECAIQVER